MKKVLTLVIACFISISSFAQISVSKADALIKSCILSKSGYTDCWIFRYNTNVNIQLIYNKMITLPNNVFAYVVSRNPEQSWIDGYEYYFVNKNNGAISKQSYKYSPKTFENWERIYGTDFSISNKTFDFENTVAKTRQRAMMPANSNSQSHKYAVIISGGVNTFNNHIRYWNNCSAIYKVLKKYYGYKDSDIYVLMSDGKSSSNDRNCGSIKKPKYDSSPLDLDGDGVGDIDYAATKTNITNVFNQLSRKLTSEDNLFVFTTDHGDESPYLCLWNNELMNDTEFAAEIDKVNAGYISILMLQCYSGGFISKLAKENRIIMTAASGDEPAWGSTRYNYGFFLMPWVAAVSGVDINGKAIDADINKDGKISMYEAFIYAREHDEYAINGEEHPQYSSTNEHLGEYITLNGKDACKDVYIASKTYKNNSSVWGCTIEFKDVKINNNANVSVDIDDALLINGEFEVELGATLEIK